MILLHAVYTVHALEFPQDTTFNSENIIFHFPAGTEMNDFQIVDNGIIINDNHQLIFIVPGGQLDVTLYEWSTESNLIGIKGELEQDLTFKITVDKQKRYLTKDGEFFIDSIPISKDEINVSYVKYKQGDTSSIINGKIEKQKWYAAKFIEIEYDVEKDESGIITGKTLSIPYYYLFACLLMLIAVWIWWSNWGK
jgi:hypothetical protein